MHDHPGTFIVLEGADGAGKGTQFRLLEARLKAIGYEVEVFDFPRYDQPSSHFVKNFLNGEYGAAKDISPYTASLFFALDRFEAGPDIKKALNEGKIVLSNRYVGSNMAHMGSRFTDHTERRGFFVWEDNLEYELLQIPRPSLNVLLKVPAEISFELIKKKEPRSYTDKTHDELEKDIDHLQASIETYNLLCDLFPKDFIPIDCVQNGQLLSIPEISDLIWAAVRPLLPAHKPNPARSLTLKLKDSHRGSMTKETQDTTIASDTLVYATDNLSLLALNVAAAAGADIKRTKPSAEAEGKYYELSELPKGLKKVFGDTSLRWLKINKQLKKDLKHYLHTKRTSKNNSNRSEEADEATKLITPLALLTPAKVLVPRNQIKVVVEELSASSLSEVKKLAKALQSAASAQWPDAFKPMDYNPKLQPQKANNTIMELAERSLPHNLADTAESVKLLKSWPRNEFEILSSSLYPFSNLGRDDIQAEVENWDYQQKYQALQAIATKPANFRHIRYHLDIVCDLNTMGQLRQSELAADSAIQPPTPRYGYEVPSIIEDAGLEDLYMEAFDESLKLYSAFQPEGEDKAGYALLSGHKTRIHFTVDAATLAIEFARPSPSPNYRSLLQSIKIKVTEAHPLLWESLTASTALLPSSTAVLKPTRRRRRSNRTPKSKR
ncbi:MAG: hypothetical protein WD887_00975 [Candidatus Saccharimonadales bacterium]